jgi:TPR repeat protein
MVEAWGRIAQEAVRFNRLAADQGHAYAQFFLGSICDGRGVGQSNEGAVRWYRIAKENSLAPSALLCNAERMLENEYRNLNGDVIAHTNNAARQHFQKKKDL